MKKTAVVTGARRGIGLGITLKLLENDYFVVMAAHSKELGEAEKQLDQYKGNYMYVSIDVTNSADRKRLIQEALKQTGRIDLLVNNAGVAPKERLDILQTTEESYDFVIDTNTKSTFFMCQLGANTMIQLQTTLTNYNPRIINISSMSAYTSSVNRGEYCISKAGISMVTTLFADRLAEYGIPVFEVRPGIIETDMTSGVHEKYEKLISEGITPIKRFGKPEDVANCVLAAASGLLDFAQGQVLDADGGFHIRRM